MGITIYDDVPVGHVPLTPQTPFSSATQTETANDSLIEYAMSFGYPVGYIQEQEGRLIQDILPVYKTEHQQISTSSKSELALHTETAFHPYKPDFVLLLCLRGDFNAKTTYANLSDILPKLSTKSIDILQKEVFITGIDESFRTHGEPDMEIPVSVLKEDSSGWSMIYDTTVMRGTTDESIDALDEFGRAIDECVQSVALAKNQLMVIDNRNTVHGRSRFQPRYDGTDRWLKRSLVMENLPPKSDYKDGVITTRFPR
jgi:alpha-ketoglutarate-dependent taurine dioxygenase